MKEKLILLSPCFAFSMCCRIMLQHIVSCFEDIPDEDWGGCEFCSCYCLAGFRANMAGSTLGPQRG